jgi:NADP-reducing hydrogenase subunit HndB
VEKWQKESLGNVYYSSEGCMGMCKLEPMVEVFEPGKDKVTYIKVTPEMASKIVSDHFVNGKVVKEYTISTQENL